MPGSSTCRYWDSGFRASDLGFRVKGLGFKVGDLGFEVYCSGISQIQGYHFGGSLYKGLEYFAVYIGVLYFGKLPVIAASLLWF